MIVGTASLPLQQMEKIGVYQCVLLNIGFPSFVGLTQIKKYSSQICFDIV
jgi:hypothetical protein